MKYLILCALVAAVAAGPATTEGPGGATEGGFPFFHFGNFFNNIRHPANFFRRPTTDGPVEVTTEGPAARQYAPYNPYFGQQHPYSDPNAPVFPAQFQMFQYFGKQNRTQTTTPFYFTTPGPASGPWP